MTENTKIYLLKQKIMEDISDAEISVSVSAMLLRELYMELDNMASRAVRSELDALKDAQDQAPQEIKGDE